MNEEVGLSLVVAMAQNNVIGRNNTLPWRLPKDLKYFKNLTMGYPIVMGRKTYDSIGRPLPGRTNIVVSAQPDWAQDGVTKVSSLAEALALARSIAKQSQLNEIMLIGGASLYGQSLAFASKLYVTEVKSDVEGDALFPEFDKSEWSECKREDCESDDDNPYDYAFVVYKREL